MNLRIKTVKHGYILYNENNGTHSHFSKYNTAMTCKKMIERGVLPNNSYMKESCRRLIGDKQFGQLRKKQKYINVNKGIPRKRQRYGNRK